MKIINILVLLSILLSGCKINEQIFGHQENLGVFIKNLEFEDYSIEKVYVIFKIYNTLNEIANCSVNISYYQNTELVSEERYYIGNIEGNSQRKIRILTDMPQGETKVNVQPLCKINQKKSENIEIFVFIEDLRLERDGYLVFNLHNTLNETINCSAKAIVIKDDKIISEKIKYVGVIGGNSIKNDQISVSVPSGKSILDVIPLCTIIR